MTSALKQEILKKEEAFLKETKAKLNEQLRRLKVEEVALLKLLSNDQEGIKEAQQQSSTAQLFSRQDTGAQIENVNSVNANDVEDLTGVNQVPLENLQPIHTQVNQESDHVVEEDEEDVDEDPLDSSKSNHQESPRIQQEKDSFQQVESPTLKRVIVQELDTVGEDAGDAGQES